MKIKLIDFEKRYVKIRERYPHIGQCIHQGCPNPPDLTPSLGLDSSCAYHRLLFDYWLYEVMEPTREMEHILLRREAFGKWNDKLDTETRNKIVLRLAQEAINWEC